MSGEIENRLERFKTYALLPPHDPLRIKIEQEAHSSPELLEQWNEALEEADALKRSLNTIRATSDAVSALYKLTASPHKAANNFQYKLAGIAAVFLVGVISIYVFSRSPETRIVASTTENQIIKKITPNPHLQRIALLAMRDFYDDSPPQIASSDRSFLLNSINANGQFPTELPNFPPLEELQGGTISKLDNIPSLATRWIENIEGSESAEILLHQFYAEKFSLPHDMNPVLIKADSSGNETQSVPPCDVVIWTQNGKGYALVAKSSDGCARRALEAVRIKFGSALPNN